MDLLIGWLAFFSVSSAASTSYLQGDPSQIEEVMESIYGVGQGAGVGTTSCTLCHTTAAGGLGTVNSDFGADFQTVGGTGSLTTTILRNVFASLASLDSDGDGITNGQEFEICSQPNDATVTTDTGLCGSATPNKSSSGGCGALGAPPMGGQSGTGVGIALLAMPMLLLVGLRRRPVH